MWENVYVPVEETTYMGQRVDTIIVVARNLFGFSFMTTFSHVVFTLPPKEFHAKFRIR